MARYVPKTYKSGLAVRVILRLLVILIAIVFIAIVISFVWLQRYYVPTPDGRKLVLVGIYNDQYAEYLEHPYEPTPTPAAETPTAQPSDTPAQTDTPTSQPTSEPTSQPSATPAAEITP